MKINLLSICLIAASIANHVYSLEPYHINYKWDKTIWEKCTNEAPKTFILKHEVIEFIFEDEKLNEYALNHEAVFINSDEEVGYNNKKYIPFNNSSEIIVAKARVLKSNGRIIDLDQEKILESYDEKTGRKYKYFALEGLEKSDIVETYYVHKKSPRYYGTYITIQEKYPVSNYSFELYAPENLEFAFDLQNDTHRVALDTLEDTKNRYTLKLSGIKGLEYEQNSPYNALLKYLVYKLDKNTKDNFPGPGSYKKASQTIYNNIYRQLNKSEHKSLKKLLKRISLEKTQPVHEKIRAVEDYIKKNINVMDEADYRYENLSYAIENKTATVFGITKIMANIYKLANIDHQIVLTTDRSILPFNTDFESYHNLSKYLLFFPAGNNFICPESFEYRTSLIPAEYTDNYGLFIEEVSVGKYNMVQGTVNYIPPVGYKKTHHNHLITATINDDFQNVQLDIVQSSLGYYATFIQSVLELLGEDHYNAMAKDVIKGMMENLEVQEWSFENVGAENIDKEPLLLKCKATNNNLIDFAGNHFLFKIGELIGPQIELYSEKKRTLPIHDDYKRLFVREMIINIPEGYEIQNPDVLNITSEYEKDGKKILLFDSQYRIEGQQLTVNIMEYYDQLYYDVSEYFVYREVINSASDFNKVALIISAKK